MIIINATMINAVYLDQYTIIDESSMINDDFGNFSKPICLRSFPNNSWCSLLVLSKMQIRVLWVLVITITAAVIQMTERSLISATKPG